jgi:hypothetical protein
MKIKSTALFFLILPFNLALANKDGVPLGAKSPSLCATDAAKIFKERDTAVLNVIQDIGGTKQRINDGRMETLEMRYPPFQVTRELGFKILQLEEDYPGFPVRNIFKEARATLYELHAKNTAGTDTMTRRIRETPQISDEEIFESVRIQLQKDFFRKKDAFRSSLFYWLDVAQREKGPVSKYEIPTDQIVFINRDRQADFELVSGTLEIYGEKGNFTLYYSQTVQSKGDSSGIHYEEKLGFNLSFKDGALKEYQQMINQAQNPRELLHDIKRISPLNNLMNGDLFFDFLYLLGKVPFTARGN